MSTKAKDPQDEAQKVLKKYIDQIKVMPVDEISPSDYNPREDLVPGDPDFEALQRSIQEFDQLEPLVWNSTTEHLVGGHQRLNVLKYLKKTHAVVFVVTTDEEREKALNLALNKALGRWDPVKLMSLVDTLSPEMLSLGGFDSRDEAYELMRAVQTGSTANFLDEIIASGGADYASPAGGATLSIDDDEEGESADGTSPAQRERLREIDLKEDHVHRTGIQYFDVILQLTAEQRAIFYQAVNRSKRQFSTDNTFEAVVYILDEYNKAWDQAHPSETATTPEDLA